MMAPVFGEEQSHSGRHVRAGPILPHALSIAGLVAGGSGQVVRGHHARHGPDHPHNFNSFFGSSRSNSVSDQTAASIRLGLGIPVSGTHVVISSSKSGKTPTWSTIRRSYKALTGSARVRLPREADSSLTGTVGSMVRRGASTISLPLFISATMQSAAAS